MEILQKKLSMPVFTCNFKSKSTGILEFGAIDSAQYKGSLTTVPVNNRTDGSWTVDNLTFSVGNVTASQSMLFGMSDPPRKFCLWFALTCYEHRYRSSLDDR